MSLLPELLVLAGLAAATVFLAVRHCSVRWRRTWLVTAPITVIGLGLIYQWLAVPAPDVLAETYVPRRSDDRGFVTSQTCRSCHPGQFASWHKTFHRTMTQRAAPETIVAGARSDFERGHQLATHGQTASLRREGEEFWVNMVHPEFDKARAAGIPEAVAEKEEPRVDRRVMLTTGSHHFQVFWVTSSRTGELWQFPWRFHIPEQRWIHRNDAFLQPPDKPAVTHFRTWNHACIHCHNTGGEPGIGRPPEQYFSETRVGELGIACESCHGPAEAHVKQFRQPQQRYRHVLGDPPESQLLNPRKATPRVASQICGQCHSHMTTHEGDTQRSITFLESGLGYRAGDDLDDFVRFLDLDDGYAGNEHRFWADGTCRSGGREYNGLLASPCYDARGTRRQMSCLSCHSMHNAPANDQLAEHATGNAACTQCHPRFSNAGAVAAHTHHRAGSSGSRCYNCHMPHTSYALFKAIRVHQVDSPRVTPTVPNSRPNACNLCHLDKTLAWTARHLDKWYGQDPVQLPEADQGIAASLRWLLAGDAAQRVIAAWHFGWQPARDASGTDWVPPRLAPVLDDPYPAVRYVAWRSLKSLPGMAPFQYDFDGPAEHRRRTIRQLLRTSEDPSTSRRRDPALLAAPDGTFDRRRLEQLQKTRDNRPVEIYE